MSAVLNTVLPESLTRLQSAFTAHADHALPARQQAFARFMHRGFPTTHDEHWKYTALRRLEARTFAIASNNVIAPQGSGNSSSELTIQFINGLCRTNMASLPLPAGLRVRPLSTLSAAERNDALSTSANDTCRFVALNTALTQEGLLIETDADVSIHSPLMLHFGWHGADSFMAHPRIVIRLGQHSRLTVIEQYQDSGVTAHWHNAVTQVRLAEGSQLEHGRLQTENSASFHIGFLHAELAAHAKLTSHNINFGGALGRMDINVFLRGADAEANLNGLQFAAGTQHHDTHTRVEHVVPHTRSNEDYRGIADQRGRVVFNGKVVVAEGARKTDAQQSSRNLLLAKTAEIDTKPELEIYNDDVKCAHGATVGQLDANALFYLRSRGLDEAQARALLTHAFADHIIRQLPVESLQLQLTAASHARFGAQLEGLA
jgi:Fe-S cluster assembly protein SufD